MRIGQFASGVALAFLCMFCMVRADTIEGNIKIATLMTHYGGSGASTLTESLSDPWLWAGTSGAIGTNGSAEGLTRLYIVVSNIVAGGTNTHDLYGTSVDSFGQSVTFSKVKFIWFCPSNAVGYSMAMRPAESAGLTNWLADVTNGVVVQHKGALALMAPNATAYAVSNGVCDSITVVNSWTNTGRYTLYFGGE